MAEPPFQTLDRLPEAALDERLRAAFRATRYLFDAPDGQLLLQIDCPSEALRQLLRQTGKNCAAILTAFNPGSTLQDAHRNQHAQAALTLELQALGLHCIPGRHEDPSGSWPTEAGLLAPGLAREAACEIARCHGQLAFLWSDASAIPRLIETTSGADLPPSP